MKQYLDLLEHVLNHGTKKSDRTGTGTLSIFGHQLRFDLTQGFPLVTTKRIWWRAVVEELLWMLRGSTNAGELEALGVDIWKEWGDPATRELGPVYGSLWRSWQGPAGAVDQMRDFVEGLRENPDSRRHIVSTWHPALLSRQALPPCHGLVIQGYVANGCLSLQVYQRSADVFLGLPFNIASYALLAMMVAQATGLQVHELILTLGDVHLYFNHLEQAQRQLQREPRELPRVRLNPEVRSLFDFTAADILLEGYDPHPAIKAPVAV